MPARNQPQLKSILCVDEIHQMSKHKFFGRLLRKSWKRNPPTLIRQKTCIYCFDWCGFVYMNFFRPLTFFRRMIHLKWSFEIFLSSAWFNVIFSSLFIIVHLWTLQTNDLSWFQLCGWVANNLDRIPVLTIFIIVLPGVYSELITQWAN